MTIISRDEFSSDPSLFSKENAVVELFHYAHFDGTDASLQYERVVQDGQEALVVRVLGLSKDIAIASSLTPKPEDDAPPQWILDRARRNVLRALFIAGIKAANRRHENHMASQAAGRDQAAF